MKKLRSVIVRELNLKTTGWSDLSPQSSMKALIHTLFTLTACLISFGLKGQIVVNGVVQDSLQRPIAGVSLTVTGSHVSGPIAAFSISNGKGEYSLKINLPDETKLFMKISRIGYASKTIVLYNGSQDVPITLVPSPNELKEVKVQSNAAVNQRGDTLSYNVGSFQTEQDRSIGDVLKKLPGISVAASGEIQYQGKPIQQLTVDGLNLMEGQYGILSTNLPADAVTKIQVVENDQRVRVLDSLVPSNETTINLKLKKLTVAGNLEVGAGLSPALRHASLTVMLFNQRFQMLHSFLSNNTGEDGAGLLNAKPLGLSFRNNTGFKLNGITSIMQGALPPFEKTRWLRNNLNQWSSNLLKKLENDIVVKVNLAVVNDHQQLESSTVTIISPLTEQPIEIREFQRNSYNMHKMLGHFVVEKNVKRIFFRNNLSMAADFYRDIGRIGNSRDQIHQRDLHESRTLDNRFTLTTAVGKQLITINSLVNYQLLPENLSVTPGPFPNLVDSSAAYPEGKQVVKTAGWNADHYADATKRVNGIVFKLRAGILISRKTLESSLHRLSGGETQPAAELFRNDLHIRRTSVYSALDLNYEFNRGFFSLSLPLQSLNVQLLTANSASARTLAFEPNLYMEWKLAKNFKTLISGNRQYNISGDPGYSYPGYILNNYRTLMRYPGILPTSRVLIATAGFEYKIPQKGYLMNGTVSIMQNRLNVLYSTIFEPDGTSTIQAEISPNEQLQKKGALSAGRLFSGIQTTIRLNASAAVNKYERVLNGSNLSLTNNEYTVGFFGTNNSSPYFIPEVSMRMTWISAKMEDHSLINSFLRQEHQFKASVFPVKKHSLTGVFTLYKYDQKGFRDQRFMDLLYRFTSQKKHRVGYEVRCNNLLNSRTFASVYTDGYTTIQNRFSLRPRQLIFVARIIL
ncbi:MAG: hypothetical protein EOO09_00435 [Chitinophagaceae bacterium]|nr:MAG: hypothetical protein EOO09_00435 [Chitinophagaceae bacterium]